MTRKRVHFDPLPSSFIHPYSRGSLVLDMRARLGDKAFLDLSDRVQFRELGRDLVASLGRHAMLNLGSDYSFSGYAMVIQRVLEFAAEKKLPDDVCLLHFDEELILSFRKTIKLREGVKKNATYRHIYGCFNRLLFAARALGLFEKTTRIARNFRHIDDADATEPYPFSEQLELEEICRKCIEELEARLELGKKLLAIGSNPLGVKNPPKCPADERAWNKLENLLWYVTNVHGDLPLQIPELKERKEYSYLNAVRGVYGGKFRLSDIHSHRYPFAEHLIPFFILLAKRTGRNESSILSLRRDCLQCIDGKYFLLYRKERTKRKIFRKRIKDEGEYSAVDLIRRLKKATAKLASLASNEDRNILFIGFTFRSASETQIKRLDPSYFKFQMNRKNGWCEENGLKDQHGGTFQVSSVRLRVTYLTRKYLKYGQLSRVSLDAAHSLSDTSVGYVSNRSTKHIHEQAARDGIKSAVLMVKKPIVLPSNDAVVAAEMLTISIASARRLLRGEMDVFFNACKDVMNRPGGPENTLCGKPWQCFGCGNTIITRHVLPRVIAFVNHSEDMRRCCSKADWDAMFMKALNIINADILPRFSASVVKDARLRAAQGQFYIPLALQGNV